MQQFFPFLGGWTWWVIAGILLLAELTLPGIFFMWLALAAAMVGVIDLFADLSWQIEIAAFAVFAVLLVLFVRPRVQLPRRREPRISTSACLTMSGVPMCSTKQS